MDQPESQQGKPVRAAESPAVALVGASVQVRRCPLLIVLSGPSGVGKTTLTQALVRRGWLGHIVVTATTRRPRPGEADGVHYHFRTAQEFQRMIQSRELLEHAEVHGNWYGVPVAPVRAQLAAGTDVILTIDPQGARSVHERTRGSVSVFLVPESLDELVERLNRRGQDSAEQRALRLLNAEREMAELPKYDYAIVNRQGHLDAAVGQLQAIMDAEHCRVRPRCPEV